MSIKDDIEKMVHDKKEAFINRLISDKKQGDDESKQTQEESEEDDPISESLDVTAAKTGYRGNSSDIDRFTVNNEQDLKNIAKQGKYEYFTVKMNNGEEVEYMVDNGTMVEM